MDKIEGTADSPESLDEIAKRKYKMRGNCHLSHVVLKKVLLNSLLLSFAAAAFLATVSSFAAFAGFSRTITAARKQDQKLYESATMETVNLIEGGTKLATRALAWGTFYAVLGTGTLVFGIWKLSGASNVSTFIFHLSFLKSRRV